MDVVIAKNRRRGRCQESGKFGLTATKEQVAEITKRVKNERASANGRSPMMFWKHRKGCHWRQMTPRQSECSEPRYGNLRNGFVRVGLAYKWRNELETGILLLLILP